MATVTLSNPQGSNKAPVQTSNLKTPYIIWKEVDFSAAVTAKGSALAAADVIEALRIPANHAIAHAWVKKSTALTGTTADAAISLGVTGVAAAAYVSAWGLAAAAVGAYGTPTSPATHIINGSASDTVDILLTTLTGTLTGGKVIVYAEVVDLTVAGRGTIAQPKS